MMMNLNHLKMSNNKYSVGEWICVTEKMPERNKTVLMNLPFCISKVDVGRFNGIDWKTISGIKTLNVCYWAEIIEENLAPFEQTILEEIEKNIKQNFSLAKEIAIGFELWFWSSDCEFEYLTNNEWCFEGNYYSLAGIFDYFEKNILKIN